MEALAALGGLSRTALHSQLAAAVQVVLHVRRSAQRGRYLAGIGVMRRDGERVQVVPAWQRDGGWASGRGDLAALLAARGGALPC